MEPGQSEQPVWRHHVAGRQHAHVRLEPVRRDGPGRLPLRQSIQRRDAAFELGDAFAQLRGRRLQARKILLAVCGAQRVHSGNHERAPGRDARAGSRFDLRALGRRGGGHLHQRRVELAARRAPHAHAVAHFHAHRHAAARLHRGCSGRACHGGRHALRRLHRRGACGRARPIRHGAGHGAGGHGLRVVRRVLIGCLGLQTATERRQDKKRRQQVAAWPASIA